MNNKLNLLIFLFVSLAFLTSCVGTVEDIEEIVNSKEVQDVKIDFNGIVDCYAISQDKIEVRFADAIITKGNVTSADLVYQAFLNGNFNFPVNSNKIENLRIDDENFYHLTIGGLTRNTSYSLSVKALDPSTNTIDTNIQTCNVRTLDEEYPLFDGLETVEPTPGVAGQTEVTLKWNSAIPAKFILGSIPADGYKIKKYKIYWSTVSGKLEDLSLFTEIIEDSVNPITSYKVTGLLPGSNYYFLVRAEDESLREEQNIKILSARTNLPAVTTFNGIKTVSVPKTKSGYTSLNVTWDKASGDFNRYRIFAVPASSPSFSAPAVNPNSSTFLKADVTNVEATSAIIPGLNQEEEYAVFVVACMFDNGTNSCTTYDGEDVKLTETTIPPLAPYAGVGSIDKLPGTAGLSAIKLFWNPPAVSQGVCDSIELYFVDGVGAEQKAYACNDPLVDPSMPCYSESPQCSSSELIMTSVALDTQYCFSAKVFENGRLQDTANKKCYTNTITKPVFQDSPTCTPLAGGTELQIDWPTPDSGDYSNYILFVEEVDPNDLTPLNANTWMANAVDAYEASNNTVYTSEIVDKALNTKKLKYKVPNTKYRVGIKTLISAGGVNYYDDNANVIECTTKPLTLNFEGWRHLTSVGPRINGIGDHKTSAFTAILPKQGYAPEELNLQARGVVPELASVVNNRIIPLPKPDRVQKNIYSGWIVELLDNSRKLNFNYVYDNTLPSPYYKVEISGDEVTFTSRTGYYSSTFCLNVAANIAANPDLNTLFSLSCGGGNTYIRYSSGSFPFTLDGPSISGGGDSGFVALSWEPVKTSTGETLDDFLFNNQIASGELDGYYIYRKEVPIASTKEDMENLLNNIQGSGSGWEELNTGNPIKLGDDLTYVDMLPNGSHPLYSTNAARKFREKANTGKVVWYTVRYRMAGSIMNYNQDGKSTDAIIQVLIPPANMASIHPWIANLQMCKQMGKEVDRENNYRCDFGGLGSTKIDNQYYYDLDGFVLVDRWLLGCNVTFDGDINEETAQVKYCDQYPSDTSQYMTEAPDRSCYFANTGNRSMATKNSVGYQVNGGLCILNEDDGSTDTVISNWKTFSEVSGDTPATTNLPAYEPSEALGRSYAGSEGYGALMSTNDSLMPPITNVNFKQAHYLCQSNTVQVQTSSLLSPKIRKRQLSSREYQHVAMPSALDNDDPYYENESVSHGNYNLSRSLSFKTSNAGSGHCNKQSRYYNYLMQFNNYARVFSGKLNYMYGTSYSKANFPTGSYNLSGSSVLTGGTDHCVSGFGIQDYIGANHFLNDHALCKKYSDDSNATCEVFPDQSWIDAYGGNFPLTRFIEDDYADHDIYKNAFDQKFFWKIYDDGSPVQYGMPRATQSQRVVGGQTYPKSGVLYYSSTHLHDPMGELSSFSFALGQPLNCQTGESYCHPDDKGEFVTRSSASDYGTYVLAKLSNPFDFFYPVEYKPDLLSDNEYFDKVLTLEFFTNSAQNGTSVSYNLYHDDGVGGTLQVNGSGARTNHRFMTNWNYNSDFSNNAIGVRCAVKVKLDISGSVESVDGRNLN